MNLLFAINSKFVYLLSNCLCSIVDHGGADRYDVYILHSDLSEKEQHTLRQNADSCVECHFIYVDPELFEGFPESDRYPRQIYYRLAAPLLLPQDLDRILYLDVDLVVINSLESLYHMDFEDNYYIACSHVKGFLTKCNQLRLGLAEEVPYINTGVMMMNLPLLRQDLTIDEIRETARQKMHTFILPDQDLLTVMHGDHIRLVDTMIYNLSDRTLVLHNADPRNAVRNLEWVRENAVIIHYFGKNKPWKDHYVGILDVFYQEAANRYQQLHGSKNKASEDVNIE